MNMANLKIQVIYQDLKYPNVALLDIFVSRNQEQLRTFRFLPFNLEDEVVSESRKICTSTFHDMFPYKVPKFKSSLSGSNYIFTSYSDQSCFVTIHSFPLNKEEVLSLKSTVRSLSDE